MHSAATARLARSHPRLAVPWTVLLLATTALLVGCVRATSNPGLSLGGHVADAIDELVRRSHFIILGEVHGTNECPAVALEVAHHLALRGHSVVLALEIPASEGPRIETYLEFPDVTERALVDGDFWRSRWPDGRSSTAMLSLLAGAKALRAAGLPIEIVAFDTFPFDPLGQSLGAGALDREERLAKRLLQARRRTPSAVIVALVGRQHARRTPRVDGAQVTMPMAARVCQSEPDALTFDVAFEGGEAWVCSGPEAAACGIKTMTGVPGLGTPRFRLKPQGKPTEYDGVFGVGILHSSLPASSNGGPL